MFSLASLIEHAANAQPGPTPIVSRWDLGSPTGSGTGNWIVGTNWSTNTVPNVFDDDAAIINGGGTAQVSSVVGPNAGSVVLGQGAAEGESGTLEILSGGRLNVIDDPGLPADGSVRVGQNVGQGLNAALTGPNPSAGTGTLRVLPGGTLNLVTLTLGGTENSMITLGGTGTGTVTVTTGSATLGRTMRVIGPNVNFSSVGTAAGITLQGASILIAEITGATHSALKTAGNAVLGGTLQVDFNGVTPTLGQSWDILDAATVSGAFTSVLSDPAVPLGMDQVMATRNVAGGMHGRLVQLFVQQLLPGDYNGDGRVDAADYVMWRKNPAAFGGIPDGYNTWRMNFGRTAGAGSGSSLSSSTVPEPPTLVLLACGIALLRREMVSGRTIT
jgi:hypothetical protein